MLTEDEARDRDATYYGLIAKSYMAEGDLHAPTDLNDAKELYMKAVELCETGLHFDEDNLPLLIQAEQLKERLGISP